MKNDEKAIAAVLETYKEAVNQSDFAAVMKLYASDAVLMAENSPPSVGAEAVRQAYEAIGLAIILNITFNVAEIRQVGPEWAFARTTSAGTITIKANSATIPEANQELFLFQKIDGTWKIARYAFSTTNPPSA